MYWTRNWPFKFHWWRNAYFNNCFSFDNSLLQAWSSHLSSSHTSLLITFSVSYLPKIHTPWLKQPYKLYWTTNLNPSFPFVFLALASASLYSITKEMGGTWSTVNGFCSVTSSSSYTRLMRYTHHYLLYVGHQKPFPWQVMQHDWFFGFFFSSSDTLDAGKASLSF